MPSGESLLDLSVPFGKRRDGANSTRYRWDNKRRGNQRFVIIQYTLSGAGVFRWGNDIREVPAGHAFICFNPEDSEYYFPENAGEPWKFAWVNFYGPLSFLLCGELREVYGPVLPLPTRSVAAGAFIELAARADQRSSVMPPDSGIAGFSFLVEWKRLLDRPSLSDADPVETVLRICRERFHEPLGIKELAAQAGISREHLTRIFTQQTGTSPAHHLRALRVKAAREMLRLSSAITLTEVALRCGFPSVKALGRALKSGLR